MSHRLACDASDILAATGLSAGSSVRPSHTANTATTYITFTRYLARALALGRPRGQLPPGAPRADPRLPRPPRHARPLRRHARDDGVRAADRALHGRQLTEACVRRRPQQLARAEPVLGNVFHQLPKRRDHMRGLG
jgi:hypothetical protein